MACFFLVNLEGLLLCFVPFERRLGTISNNLTNFVDIVSIDKQILRNNLI